MFLLTELKHFVNKHTIHVFFTWQAVLREVPCEFNHKMSSNNVREENETFLAYYVWQLIKINNNSCS